jgi:hypothetical protein
MVMMPPMVVVPMVVMVPVVVVMPVVMMPMVMVPGHLHRRCILGRLGGCRPLDFRGPHHFQRIGDRIEQFRNGLRVQSALGLLGSDSRMGGCHRHRCPEGGDKSYGRFLHIFFSGLLG